MNSLYFDVWRRGGIAATHELLCDGHSSHELTASVRSGELVRVRQGHYACPTMSSPEIEAYRVGGRLTGLSAARHYGLWAPPGAKLEVSVHPDARALRSRSDKSQRLHAAKATTVRVEWTDTGPAGTRAVVGIRECLCAIARRHPHITAFAVAESALFLGMISQARWQREVASLPLQRRGYLAQAGRQSESGGESLMKYLLICESIAFTQQVTIVGAGRVDFLVGDRLVIEVDGAQFHTSRANFEEDRRRDAVLSSLGYRVLRFSYIQIAQGRSEVTASIRAALARGDHF